MNPARSRLARLVVLIVAGVAVLAGCAGPAAAPPPAPQVPAAAGSLSTPDVNAWLDGLVPAGLQRAGIAGAAVTVVHDGRVLTSRGYGHAGTGTDGRALRPVDPDRTLFRVGSVSKVVTATAVMRLVEQGRIDLDADVSRHLDFPLPRRFDAPITMRNLLTHTAGFEERVRGLIAPGEQAVDLRDTLAVDPPEQVFAPGTTPAYSNYGYGLAGYVVERVTGMPFESYVQREVLDRAGMTSSTFAQPLPPALRDRLSGAYPTDDAPAAPFETVTPAPAGSLTASATDMGRFLLAALGEPGRAALSPATRGLMEQPALGADSLGTLAGAPRMALGLFDESRGGHRAVGHGGDTQFFHAHTTLFPDDRTAVFVALNGNGRGATDSLDLRDAVTRGFADRYLPAPSAPAVRPVAAATGLPGHAAMAEGTYVSARASFSSFLGPLELAAATRVAARPDGTVVITPGLTSPTPAVFREVRPWVWQQVGGQQRTIAMRPSADGSRVEAIGYESAFTLLRASPARDAALIVPVLVASVAVLVLALLAWPAGALARRHYGVTVPATGRGARLGTRAGAACAVLAVGGWAVAILAALSLVTVPAPLVVAVAVLQWAALLGIVPAALGLVSALRRRAGATRVLGWLLVVAALIGVGWVAVAFGLLTPSLSY